MSCVRLRQNELVSVVWRLRSKTDQRVGVGQRRLRVDSDVGELWNWAANAVKTQLHVSLTYTHKYTQTGKELASGRLLANDWLIDRLSKA